MAGGSYWDQARGGRLDRRRLLSTIALGSATAFVAACGGSSSSKQSATTNGAAPQNAATAAAQFTAAASGSALATAAPTVQSKFIPRTNTTAQAVPGGIWASYNTFDATDLDMLSSVSFTAAYMVAPIYPRLLNFKPGVGVSSTGQIAMTGFAESLEQPDPTTTIMHLRKNAIWDRRAPTSGRPVDSSDVLFSWNKFAAKSPNKVYLSHAADPIAPVDSMSGPDQFTVQVKEAAPFAPLLGYIGYGNWFRIYPKESDGGFDPKTDARGFGAWTLQNYQRSVIFQYRKNPDFYLKDQKLPLLDGIDAPIIAEYASGLAQFKAKKIWSFVLQQQDIVDTYKGQPELLIDKNAFARTSPSMMFFGIQPDSPFRDPRVRQAVSMLIDRDAWIDTFFNVSNFNKAGFGVNVRYHSHISSGEEAFWIDPKTPAMGDGGVNFQFSQSEAKKLLQATGLPLPIQTDIIFVSTSEYGSTFPQYAQAFKGMLEDSGLFKLNVVNPDYQTTWVPKIVYGKGDWKGIGVVPNYTYPDVGGMLYSTYHTGGRAGLGAYQGKNGDAQGDALIEAQLKEFDAGKRKQIIQDWQRHMATQMTAVPFPGQAETFTLSWPWLGNFGVYRVWITTDNSISEESYIYNWFDKSKFTG